MMHEYLINELSLHEQFNNFSDFRKSLIEFIKIIRVLQEANQAILKKYDFYNSMFAHNQTFQSILRTNDDSVVKFKSLLANILNKGFWEDSPMHNPESLYVCEGVDHTNNYSIAESCERDKLVVSFEKSRFLNDAPCLR